MKRDCIPKTHTPKTKWLAPLSSRPGFVLWVKISTSAPLVLVGV